MQIDIGFKEMWAQIVKVPAQFTQLYSSYNDRWQETQLSQTDRASETRTR